MPTDNILLLLASFMIDGSARLYSAFPHPTFLLVVISHFVVSTDSFIATHILYYLPLLAIRAALNPSLCTSHFINPPGFLDETLLTTSDLSWRHLGFETYVMYRRLDGWTLRRKKQYHGVQMRCTPRKLNLVTKSSPLTVSFVAWT